MPIYQAPAIMGPKSERSGEVVLLIDLDAMGNVVNPRIAASSGRSFDEAALKAVENWQYSKADSNSVESLRNNIPLKFEFVLRNGKNKILRAQKLKMKIDIPGGYEAIGEDATFLTTGSRIRRRP